MNASEVGADSISARNMAFRTNKFKAGENGFRPYRDTCLVCMPSQTVREHEQ